MVGQLALTAVLLVVAGLMLRSLNASLAADVGFRTDGLALVASDTDMVRYSPERGGQFWTDALERVKALPGVESAALASPRLPFDINYNQTSIRIDGKDYGPDERGEVVRQRRGLAGVLRDARHADRRGPRVHRGRSRGRAARRGRQPDDGAHASGPNGSRGRPDVQR